ncbi:hypothetical protein [Mycobacterium sp. DL99]|uniref:hypothetical protein n=1 Tax=Mycobacterium sp. DL99 TaxID=2528957 RepID=UPI0010816300|nr:hypothetical protein [Mycobacterium sp. DL99]
MTFPNGPFGQGFPDQPGYPPQPGYPQQPVIPVLSGNSGEPQANAVAAGEPSGATGITAAVLAAFGAVAGLGSGVIAAIAIAAAATSSAASGREVAVLISVLVLNSGFGLMNAIGAVLLYERKMRGRRLVVGACAMAILSTLVIFVATAAQASSFGSHGRSIFTLVTLVFPIVTLVLALLPSTGAWIEAKQKPVAPQPYPPYPGW